MSNFGKYSAIFHGKCSKINTRICFHRENISYFYENFTFFCLITLIKISWFFKHRGQKQWVLLGLSWVTLVILWVLWVQKPFIIKAAAVLFFVNWNGGLFFFDQHPPPMVMWPDYAHFFCNLNIVQTWIILDQFFAIFIFGNQKPHTVQATTFFGCEYCWTPPDSRVQSLTRTF